MSKSAFVFLVRHGEAAMPDEAGRWGLRTAALTDRGIGQIERLARELADTQVDHLYCSTIPRAQQSAAILARVLDREPVAVEELYEIDIGDFEGMTLDMLRVAHTEFLPWIECSFFGRFPSADFHHPADLGFPGGEDVQGMYRRAVPAFADMARRGIGRTSVFVGHAWLIQALLCHVTGTSVSQYFRFAGRNASLNLVEVDARGRGVLHLLNAHDSLADLAGGRLSRRKDSGDRPSLGGRLPAAEPTGS